MVEAQPFSLPQAARRTWDVVVIGAGVAGAVAARQLALRQASVLLVDKATFPRWKVCGCCLNPAALALLDAVGLGDELERLGAVPISTMRLGLAGRQADLRLAGWKVLSRERLDHALATAARQAGATFLPETLATLGPVGPEHRQVLLRRQDEVQAIAARLVLAADGLGNRLSHPEEDDERPAPRIGAGAIAERGPEFFARGVIFMACGPPGYVGLVRLEDGRLNLAAALDTASMRQARNPGQVAADLLAVAGWPAIPDLAELPWRGTPTMTRRCKFPAGDRLLVVGDAAGYVEPFTGEGMSWGLRAGLAAAELARRGWHPRLADRWAARQRQAAIVQQRFCRAVTWVSHRPRLAGALVRLLSHFPGLAGPITQRYRRESKGQSQESRVKSRKAEERS